MANTSDQEVYDGSRNTNRTEDDRLASQMQTLSRNIENLTYSVDDLIRNGGMSQSSARDTRNSRQSFSDAYRSGNWRRSNRNNRGPQGFLDNLEAELTKGFFGSGFRQQIGNIARNFATQLNVSVSDIPNQLGKNLGQSIVKSMRNNPRYNPIFQATGNLRNTVTTSLQTQGSQFISNISNGDIRAALGNVRTFGDEVASAGFDVVRSLSQFTPQIIGAAVAFKLLNTALTGIANIAQALSNTFKQLTKVANRDVESRKENLKLAQKRMVEDYETLVREPFELLKEAANSVIQSWNSNLTTITATQGYTKSDVQDLMSVLAQRLQSEGLSSYISGSTIIDNLSRVLQSGLSGAIAEEFAYQATVLGKAIPTQDFFGYASTYASIAANAVRMGETQAAAIQTANKSLQSFASGLLYASRELTGGFSTGLTNASSLYEQSAKIALAAQSDNMETIASVLLAVQGYVGATAPDLASQLTDTVYRALVGGNSANLVALRSLAGVNASNTEFLREFARNPQKIFASLFENLASMYSSTSDAYMEKAEGYAELFGLTTEAFQRVDFAALATAIREMNTSNASLNQNMELLLNGQTTTTAEQLKAQQINQYMIDEGLSYVIDNEAAQLIQQHMWDEQMARELMEAHYAVDLTGSSMELLEALKTTVNNILNFLNPLAWIKKIGNLINTSSEQFALDVDTKQLLELGKVGTGNQKELYQLTTRNTDLQLTQSLVDMMGGVSFYSRNAASQKNWTQMTNLFNTLTDSHMPLYLQYSSAAATKQPASSYNWGTITKSQALAASSALKSNTNVLENIISDVVGGGSAQSTSATKVTQAIESMLKDTYLVDEFVKQGKSYEDWAKSASKFGIADISEAIQSAGYTVADIQSYFQKKETEQGVAESHRIQEEEEKFRNAGISFWTETFPSDFRDPLFETLATTNQTLESILDGGTKFVAMYKTQWLDKGWAAFMSAQGTSGLFNKFYNEFMKYFINHVYYSSTSGYTYQDVEEAQRKHDAQERGDTVYALAEMLTKNLVDLQDPTLQTNAILAQILILVNAIKNQGDKAAVAGETSTLMESLSAMALGLTANNDTLATRLTDTVKSSIT